MCFSTIAAKLKLCVGSRYARFVLEACGSLVEDSEVLEEVKNEVLLLLTENEEYSPASSTLHTETAHQEQYTPTGNTSTAHQLEQDTPIASSSASHRGEQGTPIASCFATHQGDTLTDQSNNVASLAEAPAGDSPDTTPPRPSTLMTGIYNTLCSDCCPYRLYMLILITVVC